MEELFDILNGIRLIEMPRYQTVIETVSEAIERFFR